MWWDVMWSRLKSCDDVLIKNLMSAIMMGWWVRCVMSCKKVYDVLMYKNLWRWMLMLNMIWCWWSCWWDRCVDKKFYVDEIVWRVLMWCDRSTWCDVWVDVWCVDKIMISCAKSYDKNRCVILWCEYGFNFMRSRLWCRLWRQDLMMRLCDQNL